jgi:uncharacterized protein with ParB-like and HNH nuclease domain
MEADKISVFKFISDRKQVFNIPLYQRRYRWIENNCKKLFEDLERIVESGKSHFLGVVVYVSDQKNIGRYECVQYTVVDGQQRLTSIMLLAKAIQDKSDDIEFKNKLADAYLLNSHIEETDKKIKLKLIDKDNLIYEKLLKGEDISEHKDSTIYKNYELFKQLIEQSPHSPREIYDALRNLDLVYIALEVEENPQVIFESLNSTGLGLTPAELVKNYLLMNHKHEKQVRLHKDTWSKIEEYLPHEEITPFIRAFLIMKTGKTVQEKNVSESLKTYHIENKNLDKEAILIEFLMFSKYYSWFINGDCPQKNINELLVQTKRLNYTALYPVLMSLFEKCYEYKTFEVSTLEKILKCFIAYNFRRSVCDMSGAGLIGNVATLCKNLEDSSCVKEGYFEYIALFLISKDFPKDDKFKEEFGRKDFYKSKIEKYLLEEIEKFSNKEVINFDDTQVEHIMPQKLSPEWRLDNNNNIDEVHQKYLHTIGNLTLTAYNPTLSNKGFVDKKEIYKDSNISITRGLTEYEKWDEKSIKNRELKMCNIALKIWDIPIEHEEKLKVKILPDTKYSIMEDLKITGHPLKELDFAGEVIKLRFWKDLMEFISSKLYNENQELFYSLVKDIQLKKILSKDEVGLKRPYKIANDLYINIPTKSQDILSYCQLLCKKFKIEEEVWYTLKKK